MGFLLVALHGARGREPAVMYMRSSVLRSPEQLRHHGWYVPVYPCGHPDGFCLSKHYDEYRRIWRPSQCRWCAVERGEQDRVYRIDAERAN